MKDKKNWTVMIYMAGDNNLSIDMSYALADLQKQIGFNGNEQIKLFVHYENNAVEIPAIYCDFSDLNKPNYQYATQIENNFSAEKKEGLNYSEAIKPVINFVDWCVQKTTNRDKKSSLNSLSEENYALIFSGHTMGFLSLGLLRDESKDVLMTLPDLQTGLEIITNKIIGKKLAMLGFDSCVMSMFEVGQQFKTIADVMIASEGSIPNAGWSYAEILGSLKHNEMPEIAADFVKKYINQQSNYSIGGVSVDIAAWDLSQLDGLTLKFGHFADQLLRCFDDKNSITYKQMRRILLQVHFDSQTYMYDQNIDLGDFCKLLIEELKSLKKEIGSKFCSKLNAVCQLARSVLVEINNCVILSGFCGGSYQFSNGISLFFPWSLQAYNVSVYDYEKLSFITETDSGRIWNKFLQKYLGEVNFRRSKEPVESHFDFDQIQFPQLNLSINSI